MQAGDGDTLRLGQENHKVEDYFRIFFFKEHSGEHVAEAETPGAVYQALLP